MDILLDTQTALWIVYHPEYLPKDIKDMLDNSDADIYVSALSIWEIELKHSLHPNNLSVSSIEARKQFEKAGFISLSLVPEHIDFLETLEREENAPEHNDPFDQLLIAQAKCENMRFLTADSKLKFYKEDCIYFYKHI